MKTSKFWDKVQRCQHEWNKDYYELVSCETPYCDGGEKHCTKCGVYFITCECGYCNGFSGWNEHRNQMMWSRMDKKNYDIAVIKQKEKANGIKL